jgi:hypothetical protein
MIDFLLAAMKARLHIVEAWLEKICDHNLNRLIPTVQAAFPPQKESRFGIIFHNQRFYHSSRLQRLVLMISTC